MQPVILGEFCPQSLAAPSACCTVEPLQQGSIPTPELLEVGGGLQQWWTEYALLCASTGILAFHLPSIIKTAVKVTSWTLEI